MTEPKIVLPPDDEIWVPMPRAKPEPDIRIEIVVHVKQRD